MRIIAPPVACESCRFWEADSIENGVLSEGGTCHRFPPQFIGTGEDGAIWEWPFTLCFDLCGEYLKRSEESDAITALPAGALAQEELSKAAKLIDDAS